jgi:hypothetical protein
MKIIIATAAATMFAASVSASNIYSGFGQGNPDLNTGYASVSNEMTATQPSVGSDFGRYHGWADGNADLFSDKQISSPIRESGPADVYRGFDGNPDL